MIRLARPWIEDAERDAVLEVMRTGMLVMGKNVAAFEARLAEATSRTHAIAVGSGTAALELALEALDIRDGEVLCPDLSWPSPAHAVARSGAGLRLVDIDPDTWNVTASGLQAARSSQTRAAIVIDQFGNPGPDAAEALDGLPIIVDAACSLGARAHGQPAGSFGDIACMSFHPRKVITTSEGGVCLTDDDDLAARLRVLRNHGVSGPGAFGEPAGNQRMSEMAAAMGLAQMDRLDTILERRRTLAARYQKALEGRGLQRAMPGAQSNWQTFGVVLEDGLDRDAIITNLRAEGIEAGRLSYALHRLGSLAARHVGGPFPVAERVERQGLALPLHPLLSLADQDRVIETFLRETTP
ncbi:MAG: DegT/DnrJ/EryC1/StrS family aminotransferase [Sandaracinaceae bacterium]